MKKKIFLSSLVLLLATSCSNTASNSKYNKEEGNNNFENPGNLVVSDFPIDGILDEEDYADPSYVATMGGTDDFTTSVTAKIVFGETGLTVGFEVKDKYISSSTDYTDPQFVVNSDNVEFYIDVANDKGKTARSDDFAFLINPEEFIEMRNGTGSYWGTWSGVVDYGVSINGTINNDSDADDGWGCEVYLPYQTFGFTKDSTIGVAFGCRDKTSYDTKSKWIGCGPDPQIINTYISLNKNGSVATQVNELSVNSGMFTYSNDVYTAELNDSVGTFISNPMSEGTYSIDMYTSFVGGSYDNGVIIQVDTVNGYFFEGLGTTYYFLSINRDGNALLGQTVNGKWNECGVYEDVPHKVNDWNNFKIVLANDYITCYINDTLVFAQSHIATVKPFGVRAGMKGVKYSEPTFSNSTEGAYVGIDGYRMVTGNYEYLVENESITTTALGDNGAILLKNSELNEGTLETTLKAASRSDNGIIFKVNSNNLSTFWENGVSYYFFFVNKDGNAQLGRVDNGNWSDLSSIGIQNYDVNNSYKLKVTFTGNNIKCYVNNQLTISVNDQNPLTGSQYGFRSGSIGTTFTLF